MIRHTGTPRHHGRLVAVLLAAVFFAGAVAADAQAHVLTFSGARTTALAKANAYAHQPTRIKAMLRQGLHAYYVQAEWETPGPYGINAYHAIALRVTCIGVHTRLNARRVCGRRAYVTDVFG